MQNVKCTVLSQEKCEPWMNSEKIIYANQWQKKMHLVIPPKLKAPWSKADKKKKSRSGIIRKEVWNVTKQSKSWKGWKGPPSSILNNSRRCL